MAQATARVRRVRMAVVLAGAAVLAAAGTVTPAGAATVAYTVTQIISPGRFQQTSVDGINATGETAGIANFPGQNVLKGFTWQGGTMTLLHSPSASTDVSDETLAFAINKSGDAAGFVTLSSLGFTHPVLWHNGTPRDLGVLPNQLDVEARAINDAGQIVGVSVNSAQAWLYQNGSVTILPSLPGGGGAAGAFGIDNTGTVLGNSAVSANGNVAHATKWQGGSPSDLGTLPTGSWSVAVAQNTSGVAVGTATVNGDFFTGTRHPVIYQNGQVVDLDPGLGTTGNGFGSAINTAGTVVGTANGVGFVSQSGTLRDLNTLVSLSGMKIVSASGIDDAGQIVATARFTNPTPAQRGEVFGLLLSPVT